MALGQRIKEIRLNLGESKTDFGRRFKATGSLVNKWENNSVTPSNERLKSIADLAGISVDELLDDTCQWRYIGKFTYTTSCLRSFFDDENYNHVDSDFEYCPYCGRLIEYEED